MRHARSIAVVLLCLLGLYVMAMAPLARAQDAGEGLTQTQRAAFPLWRWWQRWLPPRGQQPPTEPPTVEPPTDPAASGSCAEPGTPLLPDMMVDGRSLLDNALSRHCDSLPGVELCVRVSVGTVNLGPGDLILTAPVGHQDEISQHISTCGGGEVQMPVETAFVDEPSHQHLHLQDWTELRLRKIDDSCSSDETATLCPVVGLGHKVSFCLTDTGVYDTVVGRYGGGLRCKLDQNDSRIVQGISAGWMDVYTQGLPGQLIDVTSLDSGEYWLEVQVNPHNAVHEANYDNNVTRTRFTLTKPQCNDGVLSAVEQCDPSTENTLPDCQALGQGFTSGAASCSASCKLDTSSCSRVTCPQVDLGSALGSGVASGMLSAGTSSFTGEQCGFGAAQTGPEATFSWTAPVPGTFQFDTEGSAVDTVLYLLNGSCEALPNIRDTCNDDAEDAAGSTSRVSLRMEAGERVVVVVDSYQPRASGAFVLNIAQRLSPIATTAPTVPQ